MLLRIVLKNYGRDTLTSKNIHIMADTKPANYWFKLFLEVFFIFFGAMILSFIPELIRTFLGDTYCTNTDLHTVGLASYRNDASHWHWGRRHYIWFIMSICLFIIQVIRVIEVYIDD